MTHALINKCYRPHAIFIGKEKKVWQIYNKFSLGHNKFEITVERLDDLTASFLPTMFYIFAFRRHTFSSLFLPGPVMNTE